jgi:lysophospholipase L1-like esterase
MEYNILVLGDSNTWGWIPGGMGARYPRDIRWSGRIGELLGSGYHVVEEGLCYRTICCKDPIMTHISAVDYIVPCLKSHAPIDQVVIMLGTNDTRARFSDSAYGISRDMDRLVEIIQGSGAGRNERAPEVLLIAPPHIRRELLGSYLMQEWDLDDSVVEKSETLSALYRQVANERGCAFLDAAEYCQASTIDCLHLTEEGHRALAAAVAQKIAR